MMPLENVTNTQTPIPDVRTGTLNAAGPDPRVAQIRGAQNEIMQLFVGAQQQAEAEAPSAPQLPPPMNIQKWAQSSGMVEMLQGMPASQILPILTSGYTNYRREHNQQQQWQMRYGPSGTGTRSSSGRGAGELTPYQKVSLFNKMSDNAVSDIRHDESKATAAEKTQYQRGRDAAGDVRRDEQTQYSRGRDEKRDLQDQYEFHLRMGDQILRDAPTAVPPPDIFPEGASQAEIESIHRQWQEDYANRGRWHREQAQMLFQQMQGGGGLLNAAQPTMPDAQKKPDPFATQGFK